MADILRIHQLKAEAVIGVYEHEREQPQPLLFDIEFELDSTLAAAADDFTKAVDYDAVTQALLERVSQSRYELIESLVNDVADWLFAEVECSSLNVQLYKPNALANALSVSITVSRT